MNPDDLRKADAIEVVVGQGAKPGGGGMLLGQKIDDRVAEMRTLPKGIDQRSACRHPDWTGPDDLEIKILELREITGWRVPIYIKVGATRPYFDVALAVKAGADVVVIDGMQGGTAATQDVFIENVGIPTLACIRPAVKALQDLGLHREVQLVVSGGIRTGADVAKALALGLTRSPSGRRRWWRWATTIRNTRRSIRRWAPPRAPMTTGTRGMTPPGSPRRTRHSPRGSTRWRAGGGCETTSTS
jgi:glutamate synthase domain-containing protein 2